jgi:hypothetical protein
MGAGKCTGRVTPRGMHGRELKSELMLRNRISGRGLGARSSLFDDMTFENRRATKHLHAHEVISA